MRHLDVSDVRVPVLGFGTWQLEGEAAYTGVRDALDLGYRHIDTAKLYGNEEEVGRAIADSGVDRDELFLTTKVWRTDATREGVHASAEASLRRLGVDHVDLLLIHWPAEEVAPVEETVAALDEVREEGRTRAIGVSNYPTDLLRRAIDVAPIVTDQVEYHPFLDQDKVAGVLREHGLFLTAYSPIAQGEVLEDETLREIGEEHGKSPVQVSLRWLLQQPGVVAIPRSSSRDHIAANLDVFDVELSDDEMERISGLARGQRLVDPGFDFEWD
ncbi:MAG: aldo/keto reductase [Actinobacteria bacterium]|nr:aldo/keto reductase [Actinomycetota bacterium]